MSLPCTRAFLPSCHSKSTTTAPISTIFITRQEGGINFGPPSPPHPFWLRGTWQTGDTYEFKYLWPGSRLLENCWGCKEWQNIAQRELALLWLGNTISGINVCGPGQRIAVVPIVPRQWWVEDACWTASLAGVLPFHPPYPVLSFSSSHWALALALDLRCYRYPISRVHMWRHILRQVRHTCAGGTAQPCFGK